jgi:hypothetical protein
MLANPSALRPAIQACRLDHGLRCMTSSFFEGELFGQSG